ncbi:stearoyl-CoA desaturase-like protein 2 [Sarcoptes scabiei]|uniref:Stearoyl-CoA desaturase-like protein 2 n=1 Tax=Sarcoptes scabiei TaxID=52283 RepID=A0A132A3A4_SARSC|nr:stearoyl-CoA desaturase-like protein 2 [Sarcoptes scabiei]
MNQLANDCDRKSSRYQLEIVWRNVFLMTSLHLAAIYGLFLMTFYAKYATLLMHNLSVIILGLGITCGAHRLWAHRSYEASLGLRIFLMLLNSSSLQNDIYVWSRDHRTHHKFSETDADPHNVCRGFFFSHIGWLLCRKHPDVRQFGQTISMSDLEEDIVIQFQRKFYRPLSILMTFIVPTVLAWFCWNEDFFIALLTTMTRYTFTLHATWLVNSAAHLYGRQPYDCRMRPSDNLFVEYISIGEGYHNYHHVFPQDYSASELSWTMDYNFSTLFIDLCAWFGLVWNRKKIDPKMIAERVRRTGDPSLIQVYHSRKNYSLWLHTIIPTVLMIILPILTI